MNGRWWGPCSPAAPFGGWASARTHYTCGTSWPASPCSAAWDTRSPVTSSGPSRSSCSPRRASGSSSVRCASGSLGRAPGAAAPRRPWLLLQVDHVAGDALDGLLDGLGQRRVREDVAGDLVGGEVPLLGQRQRGQELGDVGTDHVGAEDLVVLRVRDDLDEADPVAKPHRLAVGGERELRGLHLVALVLGLRLGVAEGRDLRLA